MGAGEVQGWDEVLVGPVRGIRVCGSEGAKCPAQFGGVGCQGRGPTAEPCTSLPRIRGVVACLRS